MSTPFVGELKVFAMNYAPKGWAMCNGQLLPINQNQALFSLLGTTYGGDGRTTFALPNLQSRIPLHFGNGLTQGQQLGSPSHTLTTAEMPSHSHVVNGQTAAATMSTPRGNVLATGQSALYATAPGSSPATLAATTITSAGGGQPHENRQPYLVLTICIALQGIFPSRN